MRTCSEKPRNTTSLAKLTICMAVILSLAFTANVSAVPTLLTTLTGDSVAGGSGLLSGSLTTSNGGTITFEGTFIDATTDPDLPGVGAVGNTFDIYSEDVPWARLTFDFDVYSLSNFVYGGNLGNITIEARDISNNVLDFKTQDLTYHGYPAGPITLTRTSGAAIRSLWWTDTDTTYTGYAALDNIEVMVDNPAVPSPSAVVLAGVGVSFVGWLRKRKIV